MIYKRNGVIRTSKVEKRCNNYRCLTGFYYGYHVKGNIKYVEEDTLSKEYVIISNRTGFALSYLWDITLQIQFSKASVESLANIFNNLHFSNLPMDTMNKREEIYRQRISDGYTYYSFVEYAQR